MLTANPTLLAAAKIATVNALPKLEKFVQCPRSRLALTAMCTLSGGFLANLLHNKRTDATKGTYLAFKNEFVPFFESVGHAHAEEQFSSRTNVMTSGWLELTDGRPSVGTNFAALCSTKRHDVEVRQIVPSPAHFEQTSRVLGLTDAGRAKWEFSKGDKSAVHIPDIGPVRTLELTNALVAMHSAFMDSAPAS